MPHERSDVVAGDDNPSLPKAERLLIAGDAAGAAALAKEVLISGRQAGLPDAEEQIALSVVMQSMAQVGRFRDVEEVINQTVGGLQRLPTASLLLWAAVGCEVGEAEHVGQILRNQLKFCSAGLPPSDYLATCRMYVIEVLAKSSGALEAARSWVSDSRTTLSPEAHQELLSDLAAIETQQRSDRALSAQEPPMMPPTPPPSIPEIQPAAAPLGTDPAAAGSSGCQLRDPCGAVSRAEGDRAPPSGPSGALPGTCRVGAAAAGGASEGPGEESRGFLGFLGEITTEQALVAGAAGAAVAYALYQERKHIRRVLRRLMAGEGMMLLGGSSGAAARR